MREIPIYEMADAVRLLDPKFRSFHLSKCACGGPTFQQPCPLCGFYPQGDYPRAVEQAKRNGVTLEKFAGQVERSGNVALWYTEHGSRKTVAWQTDAMFVARIENAEAIMRRFEWPAPAVIWKWVVVQGESLSGTLNPWCSHCEKSSHRPNPKCSMHSREGRLREMMGIS